MKLYSFDDKDLDNDIKKKLKLFIEFRRYLEESKPIKEENKELENFHKSTKFSRLKIDEGTSFKLRSVDRRLVCIIRWYKASHAKVFCLSNKIVQASFIDKSELFIEIKTKLVTYIDLAGNT
jgi:hypothetical protein